MVFWASNQRTRPGAVGIDPQLRKRGIDGSLPGAHWYRVAPVDACPICAGIGRCFARGHAVLPSRDVFTCAFEYQRCGSCGSVWIDPCPTPDTVPHLYFDYYTHGQPDHPLAIPSGIRLGRLRQALKLRLLEACYGYPSRLLNLWLQRTERWCWRVEIAFSNPGYSMSGISRTATKPRFACALACVDGAVRWFGARYW